ncbi:MAG: hypothetical protein AAGJ11_19920, partial [Bacteroidota bacterium]
MDNASRPDDDLASFFDSPDARHAALEARREPEPSAEPASGTTASVDAPVAPLTGDDAELGAFFGSPDVPTTAPAVPTRPKPRHAGDGASGDGAAAAPPVAPAAPP